MDEDHHQAGDQREKVEKMASLTVTAARGQTPAGQVVLPLAQIANGDLAPPEARALARALIRIIKGERDPVALALDLTPEYAEVVWEVLEELEAPVVETDQVERVGLTFEQLLQKVAEACTGQVILWQNLWTLTEELTEDARLSPDIRILGQVLRKVLAGERQKHILAELSPRHRDGVARLLDWLVEQAAAPGQAPGSESDGEEVHSAG